MIEIPEAENLSRQLAETVGGKQIVGVVAGFSPHKFAWYHGAPKDYDALLRGKTIDTALARGGMVEIRMVMP
jgi:formamidopyrimidine-DNA glycosylase